MGKQTLTNTLAIVLSLLLLIIIGFLLYFIFQLKKPSPETPSVPLPTPLVIPSRTLIPTLLPSSLPTNTPASKPTPIPTSLPTQKPTIAPTKTPSVSDAELIKNAMASKHNKTPADTQISISKNNGTHVWGSVSFSGEMGGGWFLAYKQNGTWIIVDDGNGTIECSVIAPYNFPVDMVPECYNSATDQLIKR